MKRSYKRTLTACYLGFVTQAISANFAPLLYLTFHRSYGIPLGRIAMISTVFFLTQLVVDILCARYVDRIGYRKCILASCLCSAGGLMGLAVLPELLGSPFWGILLSAVVYAVGSGLIEVLCSPIVEACPFQRKEAVMSLLHSFYCWGSVGVVIASTAFFRVFGIKNWKLLACLWALVPLFNIYNFATCPIEPPVKEGHSMSIGSLLRVPVFWTAIVLMVCAGASELAMAGDLGGALGPWLVGTVSELTGNSLQKGLLAGSVFPLCLILSLGVMVILAEQQSRVTQAS